MSGRVMMLTPRQSAALAFAWWCANPDRIESTNEPYRCALTEGAMLGAVDAMQTDEKRTPQHRKFAKDYWDSAVIELEVLVNHDGPLTHPVTIRGRFK